MVKKACIVIVTAYSELIQLALLASIPDGLSQHFG